MDHRDRKVSKGRKVKLDPLERPGRKESLELRLPLAPKETGFKPKKIPETRPEGQPARKGRRGNKEKLDRLALKESKALRDYKGKPDPPEQLGLREKKEKLVRKVPKAIQERPLNLRFGMVIYMQFIRNRRCFYGSGSGFGFCCRPARSPGTSRA